MSRPFSGSKPTVKPHKPITATNPPAVTGSRVQSANKSHPAKQPEKITPKTDAKTNARDAFMKKVQMCMTTYNYADETKDVKGKQERLTALSELQQMLSDQKTVVSSIIPNLNILMEMIERNIFRPLPNVKKNAGIGMSETGIEQDEEIDPSWPHLQGVYEFFLQLILNDVADVKSLKIYITPQFIQEFLELFDSEETYERDYLKNILHKLYAKLVPRRKMIRKAINDCFFSLIHENHKFNGASELLDILASIISGFAVPLREEHVLFFKYIIIPLHKVQTSNFFFEQLLRCSMLFLSKDRILAISLLQGLLRYWPFANYLKETLFLTELQEVLEVCEVEKISVMIPKLFKRIVKCISGCHLQLADKAMCFFENDFFLAILKAYKEVTFPMLVPVIVKLADTHWHNILQESLIALKSILKEIDATAFEEALNGQKKKKELQIEQDPEERKRLDERWAKLHTKLKAKNPGMVEPDVPFTTKHIVGTYNELYAKIYDKERYITL
jgi:serine/threonine-protein phosphatase 2A regulatory subunit B'